MSQLCKERSARDFQTEQSDNDPLQETAFKMILEHWFNANTPQQLSPPTPAKRDPASTGAPSGVPDAIKPFLTANAITTDILEKVFHPTGPGAQLLASSIPGNGKASKLISLSLLRLRT